MTQSNCNHIIPIPLGMVNAFLLKGSGGESVLIDCGIPGSEKAILKRMADMGITKTSLKLIIITHGHSDHMGASSALREITGAKTAIHTWDAGIIRTGKNPPLHATNATGKFLGRFLGGTVKSFVPYEPEIILDGEMPLTEFGINGKIIETPGHTGGSISVLLEDGTFFVGDLIMGSMVRKGKPGFPMYADSMEKIRGSIKKVISLSPKLIYTGHGGPFSIQELKDNLPDFC